MKLKYGKVFPCIDSALGNTAFAKKFYSYVIGMGLNSYEIYDEAVKRLRAEYSEVELLILGIEIDEVEESGNK